MSDINLDFTVSNNSINFTVESNEITITPTDIQLNLATNVTPATVATQGDLLYYNLNTITGIPSANYVGGNLSLGSVANLKITGGTNGYVLQTDGTGNLDWTAAGAGGNGAPGGSNTQIQYNDSGSFGGNAGFTFNEVTGNVAIPGNVSIVGGISSTGNISANSYTGALYSLPYGFENVTLVSLLSGTYDFNILSNAIQYSTTNATGNLILNFKGNSTVSLNSLMTTGHSVTATYVMPTSGNPYTISSITIDGSSQSVKWVNGVAPVPVANVTSAFTFTIVKTASTPTYSVLGSATRYA